MEEVTDTQLFTGSMHDWDSIGEQAGGPHALLGLAPFRPLRVLILLRGIGETLSAALSTQSASESQRGSEEPPKQLPAPNERKDGQRCGSASWGKWILQRERGMKPRVALGFSFLSRA